MCRLGRARVVRGGLRALGARLRAGRREVAWALRPFVGSVSLVPLVFLREDALKATSTNSSARHRSYLWSPPNPESLNGHSVDVMCTSRAVCSAVWMSSSAADRGFERARAGAPIARGRSGARRLARLLRPVRRRERFLPAARKSGSPRSKRRSSWHGARCSVCRVSTSSGCLPAPRSRARASLSR